MGWSSLRITVDTNIILRAAVGDDSKQLVAAGRLLREAELIAIPLPCLCEFVWVLRSGYGFTHQQVSESLERLLSVGNVAVDRLATDAGLAMLRDGEDFADGAIAFEGMRLGGRTFLSFDKKAVALLIKQGKAAGLLS